MLLYGNYMNNARLKWTHLLIMYTLSCFDPLVNVMWKNMQEHKGKTINHCNLSYKFVFDLGSKTIRLKCVAQCVWWLQQFYCINEIFALNHALAYVSAHIRFDKYKKWIFLVSRWIYKKYYCIVLNFESCSILYKEWCKFVESFFKKSFHPWPIYALVWIQF